MIISLVAVMKYIATAPFEQKEAIAYCAYREIGHERGNQLRADALGKEAESIEFPTDVEDTLTGGFGIKTKKGRAKQNDSIRAVMEACLQKHKRLTKGELFSQVTKERAALGKNAITSTMEAIFYTLRNSYSLLGYGNNAVITVKEAA